MNEDTVTRAKIADLWSNCNYFAGWLVAKHQWGFFLHVPAHDIAGTDATSAGFDQRFTRANLWNWFVLKANV
jgi:hypothetical protein